MKKIIVFLCVALLMVTTAIFSVKNEKLTVLAVVNDNVPFETYDDYETALGRDGEKTKLEQMIGYIRSGEKNVISTAEIVDETISGGGNKSLKISNGDITNMTAFYSNGTLTDNDQSGAKYMKIYIKNLSGEPKGLGFYYTDIPQQTIDGTATSVDYGQEHWALRYNAYVMLESTTGEKTAIRSEAGLYVIIPEDFEGSISIPLDNKTLALPGWYIKEMPSASNGVIDLNRTFMISPVIPNLMPNAVFLIGDMYFKTDNNVNEYLAQFTKEDVEDVKNIVRTISDELTIDYKTLTINVNKSVTKNELLDMLFFKGSEYDISLNDVDGFNIFDEDMVTNESILKIIADDATYLLTIKINEKAAGGCSGLVNLSAILILIPLILFSAFFIRRKINVKER